MWRQRHILWRVPPLSTSCSCFKAVFHLDPLASCAVDVDSIQTFQLYHKRLYNLQVSPTSDINPPGPRVPRFIQWLLRNQGILGHIRTLLMFDFLVGQKHAETTMFDELEWFWWQNAWSPLWKIHRTLRPAPASWHKTYKEFKKTKGHIEKILLGEFWKTPRHCLALFVIIWDLLNDIRVDDVWWYFDILQPIFLQDMMCPV